MYADPSAASRTLAKPGGGRNEKSRLSGAGALALAVTHLTGLATAQDGPDCDGAPATIVDSGTIVGTAGNDVIVASEGNDTILGLGGDDIICAGGGNDRVLGGEGDDTLIGDGFDAEPFIPSNGQNDDVLIGGPGDDLIGGLGGDDTMLGGTGNDTLIGLDGFDSIQGGPGDDFIDGDNPSPPPPDLPFPPVRTTMSVPAARAPTSSIAARLPPSKQRFPPPATREAAAGRDDHGHSRAPDRAGDRSGTMRCRTHRGH